MKPTIILFFSLLLLLIACESKPASGGSKVTIINPENEQAGAAEMLIDLEELDSLTLPGLVEVTIEKDHALKTSNRYLAYPLNPILRHYLSLSQLDSQNTEVIFICKDGYTPSNSLSDLLALEGFLAIKDLDAGEGKLWPDSIESTFNPYYVVWKDIPYGDNKIAWPYGLIAIKLIPSPSLFHNIYPRDAPDMLIGFNLFKEHCLKCHSLNKVGGNMGPDLNYPKNILEYWRAEDVKSFTKDPSKYRYNSTMPALKELNDQQLDHIIEYLSYISKHKTIEK